ETVELVDLLPPAHGLGVLVLPLGGTRDDGLAEQVEVVVREVHELVLGVVTPRRLLEDPVGDLLPETTGAGAAEDDGDLHETPCGCGPNGARRPPGGGRRARSWMNQARGGWSSRPRRPST